MNKGILLLLIVGVTLKSFGQTNPKDTYQQAFGELHQMLKGESPMSFKKAVYLTENAYLENQVSYGEFSRAIDGLVKLSRAVASANDLNYDKKDREQILLSAAIFRVLKDTLSFENPDPTKNFKKYPYTYDMEDFWGEQDWRKMFVLKLLYSGTGNCHSMPALYKILADELGVDAWLAITPNHTYIKQWNDKTGWYNTEVTNGDFPLDGDIKHNSYIKHEAIVAGVYMDTLSDKENIAYNMHDLVQGYIRKFGYEDTATPISWLETALQFYPDFPNALILKAELKKKEFEKVLAASGVTEFAKIRDNASLKNHFDELEGEYFKIHEIGYRRMPKEMYLNWLYRVNKDTTRKPYHFKSPQPFKQYNYNVQVVTAGDGTNYEFFDQEDTVRIGTVEINRLSGKIVKFIDYASDEMPDEVISRMYDPALGRWWQIDPLSEASIELSPYHYANNNPIIYNDPTGMIGELATEGYATRVVNEETKEEVNIDDGYDFTFTVSNAEFGEIKEKGSIKGTKSYNRWFWEAVAYEMKKPSGDSWLDNFLQKFIYDDVGDGVGAIANQQYANAALYLSAGKLKYLKNLKKWISSNPGQKIPGTKKGGGGFDNDGRGGGQVLPKKDANGKPITYKEYDVNPTATGQTRDAERMVVGSDGRTYHTGDHYKTFTEIKN